MKVKLIYREGLETFFVRYQNGTSKIVKVDEAAKLSLEQNIFVGESETIESKDVKLDWTDGAPPEPTKEEKLLQWRKEYWIKNKERLSAYQKEYHRKKKIEMS